MKKTILSAVVLTMFALQACTDSSKEVGASSYKLNFVPAKTNAELMRLTNNKDANIIRNVSQLNNIVNQGLSPLSKLSKQDYNTFKQGLVEGTSGFGSINLTMLKSKLSINDYETVMAMFGLDTKDGFWGNANSETILSSDTKTTSSPKGDYRYYQCDGEHNCIKTDRDIICTSNC